MRPHLNKAAVAAGGAILCAAVAFGIPRLLFLGARCDFRLCLGVMGVLIAVLSCQLRRGARWRISDSMVGLLSVETIIAFGVALLPLHRFYWWWFAEISVFVAPAWMLGYGVGSVSRSAVAHQTPVFVHSWVLAAVYAAFGVAALALVPHLRHIYSGWPVPLPGVTTLLLSRSPEWWFLSALGMSGFAIGKDLVLRERWANLILPLPLVLLTLPLIGPLL